MDQNQSSRHIDTISVITKQGTKTQFKHAHNVAYKKNGKLKRDRQKKQAVPNKKCRTHEEFLGHGPYKLHNNTGAETESERQH